MRQEYLICAEKRRILNKKNSTLPSRTDSSERVDCRGKTLQPEDDWLVKDTNVADETANSDQPINVDASDEIPKPPRNWM